MRAPCFTWRWNREMSLDRVNVDQCEVLSSHFVATSWIMDHGVKMKNARRFGDRMHACVSCWTWHAPK